MRIRGSTMKHWGWLNWLMRLKNKWNIRFLLRNWKGSLRDLKKTWNKQKVGNNSTLDFQHKLKRTVTYQYLIGFHPKWVKPLTSLFKIVKKWPHNLFIKAYSKQSQRKNSKFLSIKILNTQGIELLLLLRANLIIN